MGLGLFPFATPSVRLDQVGFRRGVWGQGERLGQCHSSLEGRGHSIPLLYLCPSSCHQRGKTPKAQMRWVRGKGLRRIHLFWVLGLHLGSSVSQIAQNPGKGGLFIADSLRALHIPVC